MAHPTDYASQQDISKLKMSPSISGPNRKHPPKSRSDDNAKTLVSNFLSSNPNWSLDSLYDYCMRQYSDYNVTNGIIAQCVKEYIEAKNN